MAEAIVPEAASAEQVNGMLRIELPLQAGAVPLLEPASTPRYEPVASGEGI